MPVAPSPTGGKYGLWIDQGLSAKAVRSLRVKLRVLAIPQRPPAWNSTGRVVVGLARGSRSGGSDKRASR